MGDGEDMMLKRVESELGQPYGFEIAFAATAKGNSWSQRDADWAVVFVA